jgi:hypothetical protein
MSASRRYSTINQRRLQYANQATFRSKNLDDGQLVGEQLFKGPYWPRNIGLETEKTLMFCHRLREWPILNVMVPALIGSL